MLTNLNWLVKSDDIIIDLRQLTVPLVHHAVGHGMEVLLC